MAQYRFMISLEDTGQPSRDAIVNTFYLDTDALSGADDPAGLATDALNVWDTNLDQPAPFDTLRCRVYDMSDPEPREPVSEKTKSIVPVSTSGPREVALCLSYYADRNLPRRRGRMYIGPWTKGSMDERPTSALQSQLQALANGISGLGGINVQWVQYSPTTGEFSNVTDWWVDNEWDTVRSRGVGASSRIKGTVSG